MNAQATEYFFGFTSYVWHELHNKVRLFYQVEDWIKDHFRLEPYTKQVEKITFALDINPDEIDRVLQLRSRYAWKKKRVELFGKIPYQIFVEANEKEALRLMCESYLSAILTIPTLRGMKKIRFDVQKLHSDLKQVFEEKNWI